MKRSYFLCMDGHYDVEISERDNIAICELECLCDILIDVIQSYGIDEDEVLDMIRDEFNVEVRKED